jgi:PKD repeat protein
VRLWVNNQLVIDNWTDHGPTENASAPISLSAGAKYSIRMEFYESGGGAVAKLLWSSANVAKQAIPQAQLYPDVIANGTGLTGEYYDNIDFTGTRVVRTDATVNFDWGSGAPMTGMGADTFSVRWSGQVQPKTSGAITFSTGSDDGVRLWVNGTQIINNWTNHAPTENSGTITLNAGQKYSITMEFFENGGGAVAKLLWSGAGLTKEVVPMTQLYPAAVAITLSKAEAPVESTNTSPLAPVANATVGEPIQFSFAAAGSAPCDWEFGDGTSLTAVGASVEHTFTSAGTYVVTATATVNGELQMSTQTIDIADAPAPGVLNVLKFSAKIAKNQSATVGLSVSVPDLSLQTLAANVEVKVGAGVAAFNLDNKGRAKNAGGSLQLKTKKNSAPNFRAALKNVSLGEVGSSVDVSVTVNGSVFSATVLVQKNASGSAVKMKK